MKVRKMLLSLSQIADKMLGAYASPCFPKYSLMPFLVLVFKIARPITAYQRGDNDLESKMLAEQNVAAGPSSRQLFPQTTNP